MGITISLGRLIRPDCVFYPDNSAAIDGQGNTFDDNSPRFDGDTPANQDIVLEATLRMSTFQATVASERWHFINTNVDATTGYPNTTAPTYDLDSRTDNDPVTITLAPLRDGTRGGSEKSCLECAFATAPNYGDLTNYASQPTDPATGDSYIVPGVTRGTFGDLATTNYSGLNLQVLCNGDAANGDFPLLLTFGFSANVTCPVPQGDGTTTQTDGTESSASCYSGGDDAGPFDYDDNGNPDGNDGTDALTFLKDVSGNPLTFNLHLPVGAAIYTYALEPNPSYDPNPPAPPPGAPPAPPIPQYQPSSQPSGYYQCVIKSVKVVPTAWFDWDGTYDPATGKFATS